MEILSFKVSEPQRARKEQRDTKNQSSAVSMTRSTKAVCICPFYFGLTRI